MDEYSSLIFLDELFNLDSLLLFWIESTLGTVKNSKVQLFLGLNDMFYHQHWNNFHTQEVDAFQKWFSKYKKPGRFELVMCGTQV